MEQTFFRCLNFGTWKEDTVTGTLTTRGPSNGGSWGVVVCDSMPGTHGLSHDQDDMDPADRDIDPDAILTEADMDALIDGWCGADSDDDYEPSDDAWRSWTTVD